MLDLVGILFSGIMMLFIVFRALQVDASQPWFEPPPEPPSPREAAPARPVRPVRPRGTTR